MNQHTRDRAICEAIDCVFYILLNWCIPFAVPGVALIKHPKQQCEFLMKVNLPSRLIKAACGAKS